MAIRKHTLCGIYQIKNLVNGRVYIGSSVNIRRRFSTHRNMLARNNHHSTLLQRAWNKYGEAAFSFSVLEIVRDPLRLHIVENTYIQQLCAAVPAHGYNVCPAAGSTLGIKIGPLSPEHRKKISDSHIGMVASAETRAKLSAHRKGVKLSAEWVENARKAHIGLKLKPLSEAHKAIVSATHKGKTISDAHKARLSAANKGRKLSEEDKAKKRAAGSAFWATQTPEQRKARMAKGVATKAANRAAATAQLAFPG